MKQIHLSWLLMAAAVITACEKERVETEPAVEKTSYVYSVKATISSDAETRTDYDASGKFSWSAGDQISVLFNDGKANRFFTLTTETSGATATFTGTIEAGYTIGATDGTDEDLKIWALYPASENHSYTEGANPSFYVQPEVDFTETHFSANIPMYDQLTEEGTFSFKNLASTYKFTVKDLDSRVKKVKFQIYNQETYGLSGSWPIVPDNSDFIINYKYASPGSENSTLTYISDVADGQAVFYVSCRYWGSFKPDITVSDVDHNIVLKKFTANSAKQPTSLTKVQQIALSVPTELPVTIVDGVIEEWDDAPTISTDCDRIVEWRYTSDEDNVYFMYKINKTAIGFDAGGDGYDWKSYIFVAFDTDNNSETGANGGAGLNGGFEAQASFYPWRGAEEGKPECFKGLEKQGEIQKPVGTKVGNATIAGTFDGAYCYLEVSIPRNLIGSPTGDITVNHSMSWQTTGETVITLSGPAGPKPATINAEDVSVKVGKSVNIGATTNSSAAIEYVSGDSSIATVTSDGTVEGVAAGSTTITLSVPAVEGMFTSATKTIGVTVIDAPAAIIEIDGDMSDWDNITTTYASNATSRIREWKYVSDADNLYFYFVMRKNRAFNTPLCIGFDWDDTGSYSDGNTMTGCELVVKGKPFTNASGAQPVCVKGYDPQGSINGTTDAAALFAWDFDNGSSVSDESSNHYLEVSIPRSKLSTLPAAGTTINIGASFDYYFTGFQAITLQ